MTLPPWLAPFTFSPPLFFHLFCPILELLLTCKANNTPNTKKLECEKIQLYLRRNSDTYVRFWISKLLHINHGNGKIDTFPLAWHFLFFFSFSGWSKIPSKPEVCKKTQQTSCRECCQNGILNVTKLWNKNVYNILLFSVYFDLKILERLLWNIPALHLPTMGAVTF